MTNKSESIMNNETRKKVVIELNNILDQYDSILIKDHIKLHAELLAYIQSLLQSEQEEARELDRLRKLCQPLLTLVEMNKCEYKPTDKHIKKCLKSISKICNREDLWPDNENKGEVVKDHDDNVKKRILKRIEGMGKEWSDLNKKAKEREDAQAKEYGFIQRVKI